MTLPLPHPRPIQRVVRRTLTLSHSIPIIAIQASLLQSNGSKSIFFTKVLDTFEEVDDGTSPDNKPFTRDDWLLKARWTVETAESLFAITQDVFSDAKLNFVKEYVAITVSGNNYLYLRKRSSDKSLLGFRMSPLFQDEAAALLDSKNISYVKKPKKFTVTVDKAMITTNREVFHSIAGLVRKSWQSEG